MPLYLLINVLISSCVILSLFTLKETPNRAKFYLMITALICWCIPFQYLPDLQIQPLDVAFVQQIQPIMQSLTQAPSVFIDAPQDSVAWQWQWEWTLLLGVLLGAVQLLRDCYYHYQTIKRFKKDAIHFDNMLVNGKQVPIFLTHAIQGALAHGIIKPQIWLSTALKKIHYQTVLTHEARHIETHDPFWLFIIHAIRRLFWWNPLVYVLSKSATEALELSCDEHCKKMLGSKVYQASLAELALELNGAALLPMASHFIFSGDNFDIQRIKLLSKELSMSIKSKAFIGFTALLLLGIISLPTYSWQQQTFSPFKNITEDNAEELLNTIAKKQASAKSLIEFSNFEPYPNTRYNIELEYMPYGGLMPIMEGMFHASPMYIDDTLKLKFFSINVKNVNLQEFINAFNSLGNAIIQKKKDGYYIISTANAEKSWETAKSNMRMGSSRERTDIKLYENNTLLLHTTISITDGEWIGLEVSGYEIRISATPTPKTSPGQPVSLDYSIKLSTDRTKRFQLSEENRTIEENHVSVLTEDWYEKNVRLEITPLESTYMTM